MRRKPLSCEQSLLSFGTLAVVLALAAVRLFGANAISTGDAGAKYLGANSCASSSCHGGAGENQNQFLTWSLKDLHSQRPFATLTTARSKQIADALSIESPSTDNRCTSCHAPLQQVPTSLRGEEFKVSEGVSCESCHGPGESWLRSHTRSDWTHADRVYAGMRDLQNLYVRANTCVACHQTVETPLLKAGHPELIFELDGQSVSEPKHWSEQTNWSGAQAWFIGQAVALREMSWQLSHEGTHNEKLLERWSALLWLLQRLDGIDNKVPTLKSLSTEPSTQNLVAVQKAGDELALRVSKVRWTDAMTQEALKILASTSEFLQPKESLQLEARRAERLVLALDRLFVNSGSFHAAKSVNEHINRLFGQVQSLPDFKVSEFGGSLQQLNHSLDQ